MLNLVKPYLTKTGVAVVNPATDKVIATVKEYSVAEIKKVIAAAHKAQPKWAAKTAKERAKIMLDWFDLLIKHEDEIAAICTAECGKPIAESKGELAYGAGFIQWFAEEGKRAYGDITPSFADGKRVLTIRQPVGTCAAITPWNFPIAMITRKVGPALAAGCAIVLRPPELTPLCALAMEALAQKAGLPKDIFRIVPNNLADATGKLFCSSPLIRKISFTGSTPVGKQLMAQASETVKRVSMELGGNAPFIVFDDADLDAAAKGAIASKFRNAGQTCVCANRILVQESVHDEFVKKLVKLTEALKVGDGSKKGVQIGPLIHGKALKKVSAMVDRAVEQGAKVKTGGKPHAAGANFYTPTVLTDVTQKMEIAQQEIFGPVAPVIKFKDEAEAIRIANDTPFGLSAYFFARDIGRIWRVMEALEYGMVGVNDGLISTEIAPFGGIKESGVGREGSRHGIDEYLEFKYCLLSELGA